MESNDFPRSNSRQTANHLPYVDQLTGITGELDLKQRSNLIQIENCLHDEWALGKNNIIGWCPVENTLLILVAPHYAIAEYATTPRRDQAPENTKVSADFITELVSGDRRLSQPQLAKVAHLLHIEPKKIELRQSLTEGSMEIEIIEKMIRRYSVNYVASRAVTLFDIVGFGLLSPFEQMTQLNSLSYSLNSAHAKMLELDVKINFARSTTGDGFYIWNRDEGITANVNLYHFMHLVLADNAIAKQKATTNSVPELRACFHVGSCYEFHQAEGLNPTIHNFIVGEVTIELARMIEAAQQGQILVGDFMTGILDQEVKGATANSDIDAISFLQKAQNSLSNLDGLVLSGERVTAIKCYLTGEKLKDGNFSIRSLEITDKHGQIRTAYNAKINIYRDQEHPILLGIQDKKLQLENTKH
ncbi:MAG: hypothetical protein CMO98_06815 [Woeseia sp.]|nr:hypothetical protein [Woeseia sp.]|tara:strand:+ start:1058 stop:2305 length:1248 start_codon:yes stop_codon:yes gene_type:complete